MRSRKFLIAIGILFVLAVIAIFGPIIDSTDPLAMNGIMNQPPSTDPGYWLGTTSFGEDVFSQFVNGLRATFFVGMLGGGLAALIGMAVGFTAGYRGGWLDEILNMLTNVVLVIPTLAVLIVISSYLKAARCLLRVRYSSASPRGRGRRGRSGLRPSHSGRAISSIWRN